MNALLKKRLEELSLQAQEIFATKHIVHDHFSGPKEYLDGNAILAWVVKVKQLLVTVCGSESQYMTAFSDAEGTSLYETNLGIFQRLLAIFKSFREDFESGYLISSRNLIQSEVFSSELDQARELLRAGYKGPAAVVCGVVLETNLRTICEGAGLDIGKVDKMNVDLAKAGKYNVLVQKRITALADIRNRAAHGKWDEFTDHDVQSMIDEVERLVSDWLSN